MKTLVLKINLATLIFCAFSILTAYAEGYDSHNNYTGMWMEASTWNKSVGWLADTPGTNVGGATDYINLYGYVTREGDITIGGSSDVVIYDTLRITGNLTLTGGGSITVEASGVLIIEGNFVTDGGTLSTNNGKVIVKGDLSASGGADIDNDADFYVYGTVSRSGGAKFNGSNDPGASNIQNEDDLINDDPSLYTFVEDGVTLPVEFLYVQAKASEGKVNIAWATASELNNNYFTVERSTDGKNFTAIGEVEGAGDSQQMLTYNFTDGKPVAGINYYRVKQTDFDGAYDYSETVAAQVTVQNDESLVLCPNPSTGVFKVDVSTYNEQQVFLEIVDFAGQTMETKKYDLSAHLDQWIQIDLSEHVKGLYYVILKTTTQVRKGKVIVI